MKSMHVLLQNAIDYAGLFPPAGLDMTSAVGNFATYISGEETWALGRFILPVSRLDEFTAAAAPFLSSRPPGQVWRLAVLGGGDLTADLAAIQKFNSRRASGSPAIVDTVELKADSVDEIEDTMHRLPGRLQAYLELPGARDPAPLLRRMTGSPLRAKVRTGGVTADAFPQPADLLRFLDAAVRAKVPFKATAGLHHPLRADYRLTYAPDSGLGRMFGFLNVFLAAAGLHSGMDAGQALDLLQEGSPAALRVEDESIEWRGNRWGLAQLQRARRETITAFGSCSFTEPVGELQALHLLEPRVPQA